MNQEERDKAKELIRLANLSSIGIGLIASTLIGAGAGYFVDKHFHTAPWFLLICMFLGIVAGFLNIFRVINRDSN